MGIEVREKVVPDDTHLLDAERCERGPNKHARLLIKRRMTPSSF